MTTRIQRTLAHRTAALPVLSPVKKNHKKFLSARKGCELGPPRLRWVSRGPCAAVAWCAGVGRRLYVQRWLIASRRSWLRVDNLQKEGPPTPTPTPPYPLVSRNRLGDPPFGFGFSFLESPANGNVTPNQPGFYAPARSGWFGICWAAPARASASQISADSLCSLSSSRFAAMELPNTSPSRDSSMDAETDPHKNKFPGWPAVRRHASSSSSSSSSTSSSAGSDSDSDESAGPAHLPAIHGYDKLALPPKPLLLNAPAKRPREEEEEEEEEDALKPPPKKKIIAKKIDPGNKRPQPLYQQIPHRPGTDLAEKVPKKMSTMGSPRRCPIAQDVGGAPSVHRSAKKAQHIWSPEDEVAFVNGLLAFSKGGSIEFPKNMAQVYDQVKHVLSYDYSNVQLYDKMRRMKSKFQTLNDRVKEKSASFQFKSPHDATMFQLWRQLWAHNSSAPAPDLETLEETHPGEPENDKTKTALEEAREESRLKGAPVAEFREEREEAPPEKNMARDESRALVIDARNDLHRMLENTQAESATLIESLLHRRALTSVATSHVFPVLSNRTRAEALDQKWRELQILEMEVLSKRLDLLQEECKMCLEELKAPVNGAGA